MEVAVGAARWVVGKALGPVSDGLLEAWAASKELGPNVDALKMELLYAQGMLNNTRGREIDNQALNELLQKLRDLAYNAEDVLDELDYFRIQDELEGTYEAADEHAKGCVCNLFLNAHHTAKAVGKLLWFPACSCATSPGDPREPRGEDARQQVLCCAWPCARRRSALDNTSSLPHNNQANEKVSGCMRKLASGARSTIRDVGKRLHCSSLPFVHDDDDDDSSMSVLCGACMRKAPQGKHAKETPKLEFDRVDLSRRMKHITEQLQPVCAKVTAILNLELLGSTRSIAKSRPRITSEIVEPKMYGREPAKKSITDSITQDTYCDKDLTILPIVGPGGIGKTTLVQHIYHSQEVQSHFQVRVWNCVSQNFNVNKLIEEIKESIPRVEGEKENATVGQLIEQRLKSKRFLLVLDDIWKCECEDWKRLLVPLTKGQAKGNIILVTTRFPAVAEMVETTRSSIDLEGLDREVFRQFFLACVFDDQESRNAHGWLLETGGKIAEKLKGNPLAAKTVGRLLRNHLDPNHWTRVLESREWEMQTGDHDIMPALKLSYDYLPFHLQQCFSYCALFPEDYEFGSKELIHFWIGLGLVDTTGQNKRIEDVGLSYLNDLGNHGFFKKEKANGSHYYVIHDLLHELAMKVSSYECLSIYSSNVRSIQIPPSIRHLSIIIDERDVNDKMTFEDYKRNLSALDKRIKVENLRTLMLFGEYHGSFAKTFGDLFREAKALRVILLSKAYYTVEDVLRNLWKSVHLRYLRITTEDDAEVSLHSTISRFYHLRVIDVQQCNIDIGFPRDMSNLVKLRHFLVGDSKVHSSIFEVGKLKLLQELTRFVVRKESKGFELQQIGQLEELGGSLGIYNLENVEGKEEADEARLMHKKHLHKLILEWDIDRSIKDPAREEHVLESLVPHSNLQGLRIRGHRGTNCPTWLGANLSVKSLESLYLDDVSWKNLPPLGELWLVNEHGEECQGCISGPTFLNLKRLELVKIPRLKKWVGNGTSHLFSHLEALIIRDCSELLELPFSHSTCCQSEQEANMSWFPTLRELEIVDCPKLMPLPPIPWTRAPCYANIERAGSGFEELAYSKEDISEFSLEIKGKDGQDSMFWKVLDFYNLAELKELKMEKCPPIPRDHLQMLSSLMTLKICDSSIVLSPVEGERSHVGCTLPVDRIKIERWGAGGKELTQLLSHFPKLTKLTTYDCQKITGMGVVEQRQMTATPASSPPSSANKIVEHQQQTRGEEEIAAAGVGGLLLLPRQLQELWIDGSPELSLRTNSLDDDTAGGTGGGGGGLQGLHSLRSLVIRDCPKLLSSYLSSSSGFPFPTPLEGLFLIRVGGMGTLAPLSNLTSLARLVLINCGDLRGEGLWPLLAQGHLTELSVFKTPKLFVGAEATRPHDQEIIRLSSKLQKLRTDDVAGVLAAPICSLLSSSLTYLTFSENKEAERFTKEQEEALHLLTSLQELRFQWCNKLQCLPAGLHRLNSLKRLVIRYCPAIRSLPKGVLPSSLRVLDVHDRNSEELRRQCRKLTGTIPIIRA